jgi:single-strand DNA-binding protein
MDEANITLVGWLAADPLHTQTGQGHEFSSLRVGCTPRRFDKATAQWKDMDAMFLTVNCWRALSQNIRASDVKRGDPVVVTGRLRIREYANKDGLLRQSVEIEAATVGHDMTRGLSRFERVNRGTPTTEEERRAALTHNDQWATTIGSAGVERVAFSDTDGVAEPGFSEVGRAGPGGSGGPVGFPGDTTGDDADEDDGTEYDPYDARTKAA